VRQLSRHCVPTTQDMELNLVTFLREASSRVKPVVRRAIYAEAECARLRARVESLQTSLNNERQALEDLLKKMAEVVRNI
jgi:hypothetical protein